MRRLAAILSALLLLVGMAGGQPVAQSFGASVLDPDQVAYEISFREKFGLNTAESFVQSMMSDPENYDAYDVALTDEEVAELERRAVMARQLGPLIKFVEPLPDYGGIWIDQKAGGVINIGFTKDGQAYSDSIAALIPAGATFQITSMKYGLKYLENLEEEVWNNRNDLVASDIKIHHVYPLLMQDRLVVGIEDPTAEKKARLTEQYGAAITTEVSYPQTSACTSRSACYGPPLRAGISGDNGCSLSFMVHNAAYTNVQILTAGHCIAFIGENWYHNSNTNWPLGQVKKSGWPNSQYSDVARVGPLTSNQISDWVYSNNDGGHSHVRDAVPPGEEIPGVDACLSGRQHGDGFRCGTLLSIGRMDYPDDGVFFTKMRFGDYAIRNGDSGGAIHSAWTSQGVYAQGVQSGCTQYDANHDNCLGHGVYSNVMLAAGANEVDFGIPCSDADPC